MRTTKVAILAIGALAVSSEAAQSQVTATPLDAGSSKSTALEAVEVEGTYTAKQAKEDATTGVQVMSALSDVMTGFQDSVSIGSRFGRAIGAFGAAAPFLGAGGFVLGVVDLFMPSEHDAVMGKLDQLSQQIRDLTVTMKAEFNLLNHNLQRQRCLAQVGADEGTILGATRALALATKASGDAAYVKSFQHACGDGRCQRATAGLLRALIGGQVAGCDLMDTFYLHHTDAFGVLAQGNQDSISKKSAYFLALVQMGIQAHAASAAFAATTEAAKLKATRHAGHWHEA